MCQWAALVCGWRSLQNQNLKLLMMLSFPKKVEKDLVVNILKFTKFVCDVYEKGARMSTSLSSSELPSMI